MPGKLEKILSKPGRKETFKYICSRIGKNKSTTCLQVADYLKKQGFNQQPPTSILDDLLSLGLIGLEKGYVGLTKEGKEQCKHYR